MGVVYHGALAQTHANSRPNTHKRPTVNLSHFWLPTTCLFLRVHLPPVQKADPILQRFQDSSGFLLIASSTKLVPYGTLTRDGRYCSFCWPSMHMKGILFSKYSKSDIEMTRSIAFDFIDNVVIVFAPLIFPWRWRPAFYTNVNSKLLVFIKCLHVMVGLRRTQWKYITYDLSFLVHHHKASVG